MRTHDYRESESRLGDNPLTTTEEKVPSQNDIQRALELSHLKQTRAELHAGLVKIWNELDPEMRLSLMMDVTRKWEDRKSLDNQIEVFFMMMTLCKLFELSEQLIEKEMKGT